MFDRRMFIVWLFVLVYTELGAQRPALNPFDIRNRLPKAALASALSSTLPDSAANPFNVVPHRLPGVSRGIGESMEMTFRPLEALPRGKPLSTTFLFWMLVTLVVLLSFAIATKRNVVAKAWRGFLNDGALALAQKEASGLMGSTPYFLLYASFLLNAGAFIFLIARFFNARAFDNLGFLGICMALASVLFLFKHIFLNLIGWLYPVRNEVRRYNFLILIFNCVLGLFLVPFNFLIAFVQQHQGFLVFWALGLAAVFYAYRSLRAAEIGRKFLSGNLFHFLLYLCTVEIAPVILLVKLGILAGK